MSDNNKYRINEIDINACSSTDCTGLIPSLPQSEAELESYKDIYPYQAEYTPTDTISETSIK